MTDQNLEVVAGWLSGSGDRLRRGEDALRLCLHGADGDDLAIPTAWQGSAEAFRRVGGGVARWEVSVPEGADKLIHIAVNELVRQGLRFLQLEYEKEAAGGPAFVALFQPDEASHSCAGHVLRHDATGQTWEVTPEEGLLLGRGDECSVQVTSPRASSQHCAIRFARRAYLLLDLRSTTGTWLDNLPLRRGVIEDFGRLWLGRKDSGHYLELEFRVPPSGIAFLHVISGEESGRSVPLVGSILTVGRARECDLQVNAPYISREHLRIAQVTDCFLLKDLASTNGTWHNGRPVQGGRLVPGDTIEVGEDRFTFLSREALEGYYQAGWRIEAGDRTAVLDRTCTTIGRDGGCDFLAGEARLSRRHARLVWERPGLLRLFDLASFGGITVAGRLVTDATLHGGEEVDLRPLRARVLAAK